MQLLAFAILGVVFLHRTGLYPAEIRATNLDAEWLWRRALPAVARSVVSVLRSMVGAASGVWSALMSESVYISGRRSLQTALARDWPTGSMVLWVAVFLALMLLAGLVKDVI